jgi:uncharacterized protein (DUF433 family)
MASLKTQPTAKIRRRRIVTTASVCGGRPRVAGTRIPVEVLLRCRDIGFSDERILEGYPALSRADLAAVWAYAARRRRS